jgi:hypothetical protein
LQISVFAVVRQTGDTAGNSDIKLLKEKYGDFKRLRVGVNRDSAHIILNDLSFCRSGLRYAALQ